jgi:hypothetical protein
VHATLSASDPENDASDSHLDAQREAEQFGTGGDAEKAPAQFPEAITRSDARSASISLPKPPGLYRLFAFVHDDHGGAATANLPVRVTARE